MNVISVAERLTRIKSAGDISHQIKCADAYARGLRTKSKNSALCLKQKLAIHAAYKKAKHVAWDLRMMVFDIEDALAAGKPAQEVLNG